jgi:hypothetical protein
MAVFLLGRWVMRLCLYHIRQLVADFRYVHVLCAYDSAYIYRFLSNSIIVYFA